MRAFDDETIKAIAAFENMTGAHVRDCLFNDTVYFLVSQGKVGKAIGKGGETIRAAEKMFNKPIKIFEFSEDQKQFVKNLIPCAQKIEVNNEKATVTIISKDRGAVIGKSGSKIKILRDFLERNANIKELKII
ncbi:MAG: NusA-like transcription termination signal-binding factor [Candidatus Aenigmarchaeota archaeon]|nr:NusA-like transcription termination signal-binding factor [Candidatus Aenigmarchaeota archaeon]